MSTLLIDMQSGISGDMLLAGLLGLSGDVPGIDAALSSLGYGRVRLSTRMVSRHGIAAHTLETHISAPVPARGGHMHVSYASIRRRIEEAELPAPVAEKALAVYSLIAAAESTVHGTETENAMFHEVGSALSVVHIVGCCWLCDRLDYTTILSTPLLCGTGTVHCAHGTLTVPVPAVKEILARCSPPQRTIPYVTGELTTPTGCALVCTLTDVFTFHNGQPASTVAFAAGKKYIPGMVNVLRMAYYAASSPAGN